LAPAPEKSFLLFDGDMILDPKKISVQQMHSCLLGAVVPRPIALASTVDAAGRVNLSPFSFFNVFSAKPPILIFSPARRVRDNTTKHTLQNVLEVPQVCINIVSYDMAAQTSLASGEYPAGVDEFVKAGFRAEPSACISPPRVGESPVSFECAVTQVLPLGAEGGAGNLIMAEVLLVRIHDHVLGSDGKIDPHRLDAVARMGGDFYCRASGAAVFELPKPGEKPGLGVDQLPQHVWRSNVLTGNDLGRLGSLPAPPGEALCAHLANQPEVQAALAAGVRSVHALAKQKLEDGLHEEAWALLALQK
jgi:flavin reductase (DIM6/NTAB) family NADH-FMN oxidoreductase RutF